MPIQFRHYSKDAGITEDYHKVRTFFLNLGYAEFTFARWDWMITHGALDKSALEKIGLWEIGNQIIGIATYDTKLGNAYCLALPEYADLKNEMLSYANENLIGTNPFAVVISDTDQHFQDMAASLGFVATEQSENDSIFHIENTSTEYQLPEGFCITSMEETYNLYQYKRVLWKGFNHEINGEGEFTFSEEAEVAANAEMNRPNVDLNLKVAVVAPDGNFVSYCGMWYDATAGFAVVEPVATDPEYRKMGLGKAAVLEGIRRVGALGAKTVLVGSSQQFYYSIGFKPYAKASEWISFHIQKNK